MIRLLAVLLMMWGTAGFAGGLPDLIPLDKPLPWKGSDFREVADGEDAAARVRAHLEAMVSFDAVTSSTTVQIKSPDFAISSGSRGRVYTETLPGVILIGGGALNLVGIGVDEPDVSNASQTVSRGLKWFDAALAPTTANSVKRRWTTHWPFDHMPRQPWFSSRATLVGLLVAENLPEITLGTVSIYEADTRRLILRREYRPGPSPGDTDFSGLCYPGREAPVSIEVEVTGTVGETTTILLRRGEILRTSQGILAVISPLVDLDFQLGRDGLTFKSPSPATTESGALLAVYPAGAADHLGFSITDTSSNSAVPAPVRVNRIPIAGGLTLLGLHLGTSAPSQLSVSVPKSIDTAVFSLKRLPVLARNQQVKNPWDVQVLWNPANQYDELRDMTSQITGYSVQLNMPWATIKPAASGSSLPYFTTLGALWEERMKIYPPGTRFEVDSEKGSIYVGPRRPTFVQRAIGEMLR